MPACAERADHIRRRWDAHLAQLVDSVPYARFLGVGIERHGNELTGVLDYHSKLIGPQNPSRFHGGATAGFLEVVAIVDLTWRGFRQNMEEDGTLSDAIDTSRPPIFPKTIGFNINHLYPGCPRRAFARANVVRQGRRHATVQVEAWQDLREEPFAMATCNFLMPQTA